MGIPRVYRKYLTITAIAWAVCLVLFAAAYTILLKPQTKRKQHFDKKITEKKQLHESAQLAAKSETKNRLDQQIDSLQERLRDFVTDFEDSVHLTFNMGQIANEGKVAKLGVRPKEKSGSATKSVADSNAVDESCIEVSFEAGFSQFAGFVNNLERHRPVFFVHEFKIARSNQNKSAYLVTLDVRALVRKLQETETANASSTERYSVKK